MFIIFLQMCQSDCSCKILNAEPYGLEQSILKRWTSRSRNNVIPISVLLIGPVGIDCDFRDRLRTHMIWLHDLYYLWLYFVYYGFMVYFFIHIKTIDMQRFDCIVPKLSDSSRLLDCGKETREVWNRPS